MSYEKRVIEASLLKYIDYFSAVGLTGPRQSGKSTLLLNALPDYTYVTFDDRRILDLFYQDPQKFICAYPTKVIFDEVQKAPEIFDLIKIAVDNDRDCPGKFILTGSSQFAFIRGASESLAGRIGLLSLLPFQFSEIPPAQRVESIYRGGYPELVNKHYQFFDDWFSAYLDTYLNNDVRSISQIGDLRDFQRLMHLLAANTAQVLNMSTYSKELGVDIKTIKHWLSVLEASYIIFLLPPYFENFGKRMIKRPKLYFYDTGVVSYLTGIDTYKHFSQGPMAGSLFENYIVSEIMKRELHSCSHAELYFLRTSAGEEVDVLIKRKQTRELVEIKSGATFHPRMLKSLEMFKQAGDRAYLVYTGDRFPAMNGIEVINYQQYFEEAR